MPTMRRVKAPSSKKGRYVSIAHSWRFLRGYFREPRVVGAIAPSSRMLAMAVSEPYRRYRRPARVLEVGAGTGAVTRYLGPILKSTDELDICEIRRDFADIIERDVLGQPEFIPAVESGRVRLLCQPAQEISTDGQYDFVISGLPFTAFDLEDVSDIFDVIRGCLRPNGVFSYYEYWGLRKTSRLLALGRGRDRIRAVSDYLTQHLRAHQFAQQTVFQNVPPALAHHLRFNGCHREGANNGKSRFSSSSFPGAP